MKLNRFHIKEPFYGAWTEYGWQKDDWGIGLNKEKVDKAKDTLYVSYKTETPIYTITPETAKQYPVREVGFGTELYIVPKSVLTKTDLTEQDLVAIEYKL